MCLDIGELMQAAQSELKRYEGETEEKFAQRLYEAQYVTYGMMVDFSPTPFFSLKPEVRERWIQSAREHPSSRQ